MTAWLKKPSGHISNVYSYSSRKSILYLFLNPSKNTVITIFEHLQVHKVFCFSYVIPCFCSIFFKNCLILVLAIISFFKKLMVQNFPLLQKRQSIIVDLWCIVMLAQQGINYSPFPVSCFRNLVAMALLWLQTRVMIHMKASGMFYVLGLVIIVKYDWGNEDVRVMLFSA